VKFNRVSPTVLTLGLVALLGSGCTQASRSSTVATNPAAVTFSEWSFNGRPARTVNSQHYAIHTTISDDALLDSLVMVMEGAYRNYQQLVPPTPSGAAKPMECYIFDARRQWAQFTQDHTGDDAAVYLQINRGGYTVRDWFVAYNIGTVGTYAVAAHEGWHQYVARNFKSRLPPFLEEGIATMFENISWGPRGPHWNLASNPNRSEKLRDAIEASQLWGLEQLCTMHAGDVVSLSGERIETFYAQNWAFAHFMLYADNGTYRPAFNKMLAELSTGEADQYTGRRHGPPDNWDPRTVRPLLEHYLNMSMKQIDRAYQAYVRKLAYGTRSLS
jgi:hypothetical protein